MDKQIISNFKNTVTDTALIKQYAQDGYGSVLITIVAGEVTEVVPSFKHRFEKDYEFNPAKIIAKGNELMKDFNEAREFNSGAQGKTRI